MDAIALVHVALGAIGDDLAVAIVNKLPAPVARAILVHPIRHREIGNHF